jgi:hypothetical protein
MVVSPRRNHPKRNKGGASSRHPMGDDREISTSYSAIEEHQEGEYMVRKITGSTSTKPYRCPGCDQLIPTATPHIVAWPIDDVELRRHWHTACWNKRNARRPNVERTRNAPRY